MATILDLFNGNPDLNVNRPNIETSLEGILSNSPDLNLNRPTIVSSILDDYENTDIPNRLPGPPTLGEILKDSIRVRSLVDINNPLIYGSDVPRIASRSTRTLEIMKQGRGITEGNAGLIGKGISAITGGKLSSINDVRNTIGDYIGFPQPYIPTVVANKLEPGVSVQDILDKRNGKPLGKFLKDSGGGNPKTIVTQALGSAITFGKDKLRTALFGNPYAIEEIDGSANQKFQGIYTDQNTYTIVTDKQKYKEPIESSETFAINYEINHNHVKSINLADYSPVYGVDRNSNLWLTDLGDRIKQDKDTNPNLSKRLQPYDPKNSYIGTPENRPPIWDNSLENKYKLSSNADGINLIRNSQTDIPLEDVEGMDLIPFWIAIKGSDYKTHFRAVLSGISENVSPSWNSSKFYGNPFDFYTYSGVSREVSFSLKIYCSSPLELGYNWEKINALTKYAYPTIGDTTTEGKIMNPPIIDFRLGDIYNKQVGYISTLNYTYPDNSTWETDKIIGLLPKIIEVSVSITLIETAIKSEMDNLYGYTLSEAAVARMNEENNSNNFSTNSALNSNGSIADRPIKVTTKKLNTAFGKKIKPDTIGGIPLSPPDISLKGFSNPEDSDSGISDIGNKNNTGIDGLNPAQQETWNGTLKKQGYVNHYNFDLQLGPGEKVYKDIGSGKIVVLMIDGSVATISE